MWLNRAGAYALPRYAETRQVLRDWEVFSSNYGVMLNDATGGVAIISNLVGIPEAGRERMLAWATASFDAMGPMKARTEAAIPLMLEMLNYGRTEAVPRLGPDGV